MLKSANKNVRLLMLSQAFFLASSMTLVSFAGLAGKALSDDPSYATLAMSLAVLATALSTAPMSMLMQKKSRRFGFRLGSFFGVIAGLTGAVSLAVGSFWLLCVAGALMGPFQASAQYYRFAAAESVPTGQAPRAISLVLIGGLLAAIVTPSITMWLNIQFGATSYMGAFLFIACAAALVMVPLAFFAPLDKPLGSDKAAADNTNARPLSEVASTPKFIIAVVNASLGYAMMAFVMTATPLAIQAHGFSADIGSRVIQGHVIAMFLPSLFTGHLIGRFGILPMLFSGHLLFATAFLIALSGSEVWHFSVALVALGVGWNFCFVGGSALLTEAHRDSEKGKVQGLNEFVVFGMSAVASFAAGVILSSYGWSFVNQAAFAMLAVAAGVTAVLGGMQRVRRTKHERNIGEA